MSGKKLIFTNLKKKIRAHRADSERLFSSLSPCLQHKKTQLKTRVTPGHPQGDIRINTQNQNTGDKDLAGQQKGESTDEKVEAN